MWPTKRAEELNQAIERVFTKTRIRYTFLSSDETSFINYFPASVLNELGLNQSERFEYIPYGHDHDFDIIIISCHGSDLSENLWALRLIHGNDVILVSWLWDNHLSMLDNLRTAAASDFTFPSHQYQSAYLLCPSSCLHEHIPSCTAQWTRNEAIELFRQSDIQSRSGRLLAHYVDYPWAWRTGILRDLQCHAPEVEVRLLPADDRGAYFNQTSADRFNTWLRNKTSLILPIDRDLSTRVFDGLLAGQVLVVPEMIEDFDRVIDRKTQEDLGIIRIDSYTIEAIRHAATLAEAVFDQQAEPGAVRRHLYALDNHMLANRIHLILDSLGEMFVRGREIIFSGNLFVQTGDRRSF